jgi:oligopeptidase B
MNMRPDLFEVVIAHVPFVDIINTLMDPSIPLTTIEWEELGDPHDVEYYQYMLKYSPYDNVEAKEYPAMLITTGLNDPRVAFWEPAKWVARMRQMKTDDNPLLLKTNMGAGHMGASGRYEALRELALEYIFILDHFGIES